MSYLSVAVGATLLCALGASAQLSWLEEAQRSPDALPKDAPKLSALLVDAQGQPIKTAEDWQKRRAEVRKNWLEHLGPFLDEERCDLDAKVLSTETVGSVTRKLVSLQVEPGIRMEAYLLHPAEPKGKLPGVVVFHSTVDHTIRQPAGLDGPADKWIGLRLAQEGMAAVCPRCYIWDYGGKQWGEADALRRQRHPKWTGMAKMIFDGMRAADYLQTLAFVDPERLGCIGHSLGGKEVLYAAAFDERFKAAVSSEGGIGLRFSNWEAEWYLGPAIREPGFAHENHEVLSLIAPRAFLLLGGDSADGDRSWPFIEAALPVYRLLGAGDALGMLNHREGHEFPPIAQLRAYEWLRHFLKHETGVRTVAVGDETLLLKTTFLDSFDQGTDQWVSEGQPKVAAREGKLYAEAATDAPNANTIWCKRDFAGDAVIEFDACVLADSPEDNINFIAYGTQNDGSDILVTSAQRTGEYNQYHQFPNYIYTFLTEARPETGERAGRARFRKDPGFNLLAEKWVAPLQKGHVYHIAIVIQGARMRYLVDGKVIHDYEDKEPLLRRGKHAFRTWKTNLWFDSFRVSEIMHEG